MAGSSAEQQCASECPADEATATNPVQECESRLAANGVQGCDSMCQAFASTQSTSDRDKFVGTWTQTRGSFNGTCTGPLETNGNNFTIRFVAAGTNGLDLIVVDPRDPGNMLDSTTVAVSGDVVDASSATARNIPDGTTDPITLQAAPGSTMVTFTSDQFQYEATDGSLHETISALHTSAGATCTFTGMSIYMMK
jgi:hypothetical protein